MCENSATARALTCNFRFYFLALVAPSYFCAFFADIRPSNVKSAAIRSASGSQKRDLGAYRARAKRDTARICEFASPQPGREPSPS